MKHCVCVCVCSHTQTHVLCTRSYDTMKHCRFSHCQACLSVYVDLSISLARLADLRIGPSSHVICDQHDSSVVSGFYSVLWNLALRAESELQARWQQVG